METNTDIWMQWQDDLNEVLAGELERLYSEDWIEELVIGDKFILTVGENYRDLVEYDLK